jgi:hypothetical protein
MSKTLLITVGSGADAEPTPEFTLEPTSPRSTAMHARQYRHAQEMQRERLRQAEAQRLRRAALRARRSFAARLLG